MNNNQNIELDNLEIYKQIVNHMTESLWIGDDNNNTIYTNNIFCNIIGYTNEEIIGKKYSDFFDEKSTEIIKNNNINKKNKIIRYEAHLKTKKGKIIPVLCSGSKIGNGGTILTISDLSELKSLKEAEANLIKINKTKDEFISIVGHELRTPLTSIRGYLSMVIDGDMGEIGTEVKNALNHSYKSSIRLIKLVNEVLSIGKIESGKMEYNIEKIKILDIINSTKKDIHLEIEKKGIDFEVNINPEIKSEYINIDKDKLKQVLLNLLTNALKFTKSGGNISLNILKNNEKIRFEVIDTGIGIPKDKMHLLFSKFSQVESSLQRENDSGLGLGLAISKNFIQEFGSEIKVKSEIGKGSTFYFDLDI